MINCPLIDCQCIDCGGTQAAHSPDCEWMNSLHGTIKDAYPGKLNPMALTRFKFRPKLNNYPAKSRIKKATAIQCARWLFALPNPRTRREGRLCRLLGYRVRAYTVKCQPLTGPTGQIFTPKIPKL